MPAGSSSQWRGDCLPLSFSRKDGANGVAESDMDTSPYPRDFLEFAGFILLYYISSMWVGWMDRDRSREETSSSFGRLTAFLTCVLAKEGTVPTKRFSWFGSVV